MSSRKRGKNRVNQRFECSECNDWQMIRVHPTDTDRTIGYSCDSCREVTEHEPSGKTDWY